MDLSYRRNFCKSQCSPRISVVAVVNHNCCMVDVATEDAREDLMNEKLYADNSVMTSETMENLWEKIRK